MLRTLELADATETYLGWFRDPVVVKFIRAARHPQSLDTIRSFILEKRQSTDAELLGIFDIAEMTHVGNIKFEPIRQAHGYAVVGVLIGDPRYRGKGVFREVFAAAASSLALDYGLREFWLGVDDDNALAKAGYRKAGFVEASPPRQWMVPSPGVTYMVYTVEADRSSA